VDNSTALALSFVLLRQQPRRTLLDHHLAALWMLGVVVLSQLRSGWFGLALAISIMVAFVNRRLRWIMAGRADRASDIVVIGPDRIGSSLFGSAAGAAATLLKGLSSLNWGFRLEVWQRVEGTSDFPLPAWGWVLFARQDGCFTAVNFA
jgi:hypothetical protein